MPVPSLGWEDSPGEGNGNPLQYSCLENPMDRGAWRATVNGITKSGTWLSTCAHPSLHCLGWEWTRKASSQLKILSFYFHWTELNICFWQQGFSFQCLTSLRVSKFHGNPQWLRVHGAFPGMCAGWGFFREWGCGLWGELRIRGCFSASRSSFSVNSEPRGWNVVREGGKYNSENMKNETQGDSHALL